MATLKKSLRYFLRFLLGIVVFLLIYLLFSWLLPFIKVNSDFTNASDGVAVFVQSNGVHTDIIMPVESEQINWNELLPYSDFVNVNSCYKYVGIGWGDKGFFIYTPTWDDLTVSTACKAAFGLGSTAMHVKYKYNQPKLDEMCKRVVVTKEQYQKLIDFILSSFQFKNAKPILIDHDGYTQQDRFYEANGTYSMFYTCNVWTGKALKATGVKIGIWTPFQSGIVGQME